MKRWAWISGMICTAYLSGLWMGHMYHPIKGSQFSAGDVMDYGNVRFHNQMASKDLLPFNISLKINEYDKFGKSIVCEGKIAVHVWKGGKSMPVRNLVNTVRMTAERLGMEPTKCILPMIEICAVESNLGHIIKQKNGKALSPWQIEPETWDELLQKLKKHDPESFHNLMALYDERKSEYWNRTQNIPFACASAMLFVQKRYPGGFAKLKSLKARADMWKRWYNTPLGKGTPAYYMAKAKEHIPVVLVE